MLKYTLLGLLTLCLFNISVHANPASTANRKEAAGIGIGAVIGGLIAGPPGAIIGAAGGAWYGDKAEKKDDHIMSLEQRLLEKQGELVSVQEQFANMQSWYGQELQKVSLQKHRTALEELSNGISLTVYFRTNSTEIAADTRQHIGKLAAFLSSFPEIQLQLDAHADQRGNEAFNTRLSQQRAVAVEQALIAAGIPAKQIHSHAYGESQASAKPGDQENYVFDRRVNIRLSLDTEI